MKDRGGILLCMLVLLSIPFTSCYADSIIPEQQKLDKVTQLPGQNFNVDFSHYAGYITVDEYSGKAFFYWFMEAYEDPASKPLALWFNGGPACSSVGFGEAEEIGPFRPNSDGKSVHLNPHAWNKLANIIFVESPVGTGFSYSNTSSDYENASDKSIANDHLQFVLGFLERFPQFKGNDFYLLGESYAGHYAPQLSSKILSYNQANEEKINLKGFMIGNPLIDDYQDQRGIFQFLYTIGLISEATQNNLMQNCVHEPYLNPAQACVDAKDAADVEIGDIDTYSIFTPTCKLLTSLFSKRCAERLLNKKYDPCTDIYSTAYFNLPEVQNAIHVKNAPVKWQTCSDLVRSTWKKSSQSNLPTIKSLATSGIRIWIYSGNTDATVPITSTIYSIKAMKLPIVGPHAPWYLDDQVGGWTEEYKGLTFVSVNGGGHDPPLHKPKEAFKVFEAFLSGTPLSSSTPKPFSDS